jgi:hypothetical protein
MNATLRVKAFPDDDVVFVNRVSAAVARLESGSDDPIPVRERLMGVLQELLAEYPKLEIRQQNDLASFEAEPRLWYVYREGKALSL